MVRSIITRALIYEVLGKLLFSAGIVLACFVGARIARQAMDRQITAQSSYLFIAVTPAFELPPATPLPTFTPTPTPTATPPPLPAIRLAIPAIALNASIQEISPTQKTSWDGKPQLVWEPIAFAVAHYNTSGNPTGGENIVFSGHNNTLGEVFRRLGEVNTGDELILFSETDEFHYQVSQKLIIPYLGFESAGDEKLQSFAAPQSVEMVTLISCWPYLTNANRIIIIAVPIENVH